MKVLKFYLKNVVSMNFFANYNAVFFILIRITKNGELFDNLETSDSTQKCFEAD